VQTTELT